MSWHDNLARATDEFESIVCMGMDPVIEKIEKALGDNTTGKVDIDIPQFYKRIITRCVNKGIVPGCVKPNYAFYAQYGFDGLKALQSVIKIAKKERIPVLLDAKRGDIGKTSTAYSKEVFEFWDADAVTIAPYMGSDSVGPFIDWCNKKGKGVYILARTSNAGAKNLQNLTLQDGRLLYQATMDNIFEWGKEANSNVGFVAGATTPEELNDIMQKVAQYNPNLPALIPGVGSQGGDETQVTQILAKNKINLKYQRINSSSGINYAFLKDEESKDFADAAVKAIEKLNQGIKKGEKNV